MTERPEDVLLPIYDRALGQFGDTAQGALWPNEADRILRFEVMLDLLEADDRTPTVLCDLGCGTGELLARIRERGLSHVQYIGIDRSALALDLARAKFPEAQFHLLDVNAEGADLNLLACDYLVANGLFTFRQGLSQDQMRDFLERSIRAVWPKVRRGIAFNVMSKQVDWERDDLFHASMDDMAGLLHALAGRRVRMRADYGLYEYTCYAWRGADGTTRAVPAPASTAADDATVPVLRPRLPRAEALLPYLRRMDASRVYSNFGPLVREFEARLGAELGLDAHCVTSAGSGTAAIAGAILASAGRAGLARPLALMPAYTFVATAVAARECGFDPVLGDIDANRWMLDPQSALEHPALDRIGVVIPVSAYGRPVPQAPWRDFQERTGIAVVIDGAASFEALCRDPAGGLGNIPVALSLHATKSLGTGEGGCVLARDPELVARATQAMNFGFRHSRDSAAASINGKMSEYHAAVGLAELDGWQAKQAAFASVLGEYRRQTAAAGLAARLSTAPDVCSSYVLFQADNSEQSTALQSALSRHRVEFRLWYGLGLHRQTHFGQCQRSRLDETERLAPCLIGLPMAPDMTTGQIARVIRALAEVLC